MKQIIKYFCIGLMICIGLVLVNPQDAFALRSGDWEYEVTNNKATITKYYGAGGNVTIPSSLGGYSVTSIGNWAFQSCTTLTSVTIPSSVTSIGNRAFYACYSLMRVGLPDPLPRMGSECFKETPYEVSILSASFDLEQVRKDSKEAKDKATEAVENALNIISRIDNTTYGLSALNTQINELKNNSATKTDITNLQKTINSLQETMAPIIISIKGRNGATATTSTTISVDVTASNATHYRAGVNGNYTAWQESPNIDHILLPNSGVNTIEVQARRGISEEAPITKGYLTVFRL